MEEEECEECEEGAPAWMATFSDMATLLLTFFVLLLSFANMDVQNFKVALGSVKEALGVQMKENGDFEARSSSIVEFSETPPSVMMSPQKANEVHQLRKYIKQRGMQHRIQVMGTSSGIVLRVKDIALFDTGSDKLRNDSEPVLALVEDLFNKSRAGLSIEGHTDNVPIARTRFPSNWELSAARAAAVLKNYVRKGLAGGRLSIAGYGDLRPIATNETEEGRRQNRRVEFVFRRESGQRGRLFNLEGDGPPADEPEAAEDGDAPEAAGEIDGEIDGLPKGEATSSDQPVENPPKSSPTEATSASSPTEGAAPAEDGGVGPSEWTGPNLAQEAKRVKQQDWEWTSSGANSDSTPGDDDDDTP